MLQKSYLKYQLQKSFGGLSKVDVAAPWFTCAVRLAAGVVGTPEGDLCGGRNGQVLCGANEQVLVWDSRTGTRVAHFDDVAQAGALVTRIVTADGVLFAVGYTGEAHESAVLWLCSRPSMPQMAQCGCGPMAARARRCWRVR